MEEGAVAAGITSTVTSTATRARGTRAGLAPLLATQQLLLWRLGAAQGGGVEIAEDAGARDAVFARERSQPLGKGQQPFGVRAPQGEQREGDGRVRRGCPGEALANEETRAQHALAYAGTQP